MRRAGIVFICAVLAALGAAPAADAAGVTLASGTFAKASHKNGIGSLPDSAVVYRVVPFTASDGVSTVIRGRVPRARTWAFSIYESQVSPIDVLVDRTVQVHDGRFMITVRSDCHGAANCLDAAKADHAPLSHFGTITFRLYDPVDLGTGETGGVPLPTVSYVADGPDAQLDVSRLVLPTENPLLESVLSRVVDAVRGAAATNGPFPPVVAQPDNEPPPQVVPLKDTKDAYFSWLGERGVPRPLMDAVRQLSAGAAVGGFGALDMQFRGANRYVGTLLDLDRGNLELRFRAPTYRAVPWDGPAGRLARMDGREQLRYWSVCAYKADLQESTCRHDAQFRIGRDRAVRAVVAPRCPVSGYVNCLATGSQALPDFLLLVRNQLPSARFAPHELAGPYAVTARYVARVPQP